MAAKATITSTITIPPPVSSITTIPPKIVQNTNTSEMNTKKDTIIKTINIDKKTEKDNVDMKPPPLKKPALEVRYNELLKIISDVGKDIKPSYTNSKSHSDRLRKNISGARNVLRECLGELDRISRNELLYKSTDL